MRRVNFLITRLITQTLLTGRCLVVGLALLSISLTPGVVTAAWAKKGAYEWAFLRLDHARKEKVSQLKRFSDRIHTLALQAGRDSSVSGCFDINRQYAAALEKGAVPDALTATVEELRAGFNRYYIENYFSFYDILFIDRLGKVFYTLRKEADLNANLMQKEHINSALARCLAKQPEQEVFVDFHHYGPSAKPAAFFVEPMRKGGRLLGWVALQCALNKVNTIFSGTEELGRTGETFLVNRAGLMLTESNFSGDSTTLKQRLDDRNIHAKFADKAGNRTVTDYRGHIALTSFQVVPFLKTRWLVVAKVDRDEVVTQHYVQRRWYYADKLLEDLRQAPVPPLREVRVPAVKATLRVDMDESTRAHKGERLQTFGVSTCTGLVVSYPGKFAYMAHISPIDKMYGQSGTNLVGQLINKVKSFDIYPREKRAIGFAVVATHQESLLAIIDKLVAEGFLLSQIRVLLHPEAASATISYDYVPDKLYVFWRLDGYFGEKKVHTMPDTKDIGEIVRRLMQAEEQAG